MRGILKITCCGGGAINAIGKQLESLMATPSEFADIEINVIDTTDKTVKKYKDLEKCFYPLKYTGASDNIMDGAGGERREYGNVNEFIKGAKAYIDNVLKTNMKNEFHIVIFSGAGGSGGVIGPVLVRELVSKDYNVIPITIGDSSTLQYTNNTINTLLSLQNFAIQEKVALGSVFINNTVKGRTTPMTENNTNIHLKKFIYFMGALVGGYIRNIDLQDVRNFIMPSRYQSFTINPGLYRLSIVNKELVDIYTILSYTLIRENDEDTNIKIKLIRNKDGIITKQIENEFSGEFPWYFTFRKEVAQKEIETLKGIERSLAELRTTTYTPVEGLDSSVKDPSGLIL